MRCKQTNKNVQRPDEREQLSELEQLPNVGPAIAGKLRRLGHGHPQDLKGQDPYEMYEELCRLQGARLDPCLLDVFIAAVEYMNGTPARPWWRFTAQRKRCLASRGSIG